MSNLFVAFTETKTSDLEDRSFMGEEPDTIFKTDFSIRNIPVALANTLRRTFSTLCPTVTFDDTYYNNNQFNSIRIEKNTSSLHNEFVSHRISLIPINMDNKYFKKSIVTECNDDGERTWKFIDSENLPQFSLDIKNTIDKKSSRDTMGIIDVTTHNFIITTNDFSDESKTEMRKNINPLEFFLPDFYTSEPILINKLKSNMASKQDGEEMIIQCIPKIGLGKKSSKNDPTGTVKYSFEIDNSRVEDIFNKKLQFLQKERLQKGLNEYTDLEIEKLKRSFNLLDRERVYQKNSNGDPNYFNFSVESIGFMSSSQIIYDSVINLRLSLIDIKNSFILTSKNKNLNLKLKKKIEVNDLEKTNVNNGCVIKIIDENHTIGNLVQYYLRKNFLNTSPSGNKILNIAGYRMNHPTIEEIEFILSPLPSLTKTQIVDNIKTILSSNSKFADIDYDTLNSEYEYVINNYLCVLLFIISINNALVDIDEFIQEFSEHSGISDTFYEIKELTDSSSYFNINMFM